MNSTMIARFGAAARATGVAGLTVLVLGGALGTGSSARAQEQAPTPPSPAQPPPAAGTPPAAPRPPEPDRGWLGVQIQPLDEGLREAFDFRKPGVLVGAVSPGSPAERAGVKRGDILVSVDGKKVATPEELTELVRRHKPGDSVAIGRVRDGTASNPNAAAMAAQVRPIAETAWGFAARAGAA